MGQLHIGVRITFSFDEPFPCPPARQGLNPLATPMNPCFAGLAYQSQPTAGGVCASSQGVQPLAGRKAYYADPMGRAIDANTQVKG